MEKALDTVLGKNTTEYRQKYAPDYLVRIPRQENRDSLKIKEGDLPFRGFDCWHNYEASFLANGFPVNGIVKLIIPASSKYIVESKSLKLYFFSFIMENLGGTKAEAIRRYEETIRMDLTNLLDCAVKVVFHNANDIEGLNPIEDSIDCGAVNLDMEVNTEACGPASLYTEDASLLESTDEFISSNMSLFVKSSSLKSNCRVTHQPDWGEVYIYMEGRDLPSFESLLKYIISFRGENHFHEEIVETIFQRLNQRFNPVALDVMAFYTRRGGIDICPMRSTRDNSVFQAFENPAYANYRAIRS